jgi:restriction system protein
LIKFISGLLNYLNKVTDDPTASNDIDIKLNVQSPGILEFIGSPIKIAIIALIFLFIVGGEAKFSKQGYDIEFSLKTQGLIEKGIQYYERVLKENIDPSELKDEIEQLKIKDPTGIPRV